MQAVFSQNKIQSGETYVHKKFTKAFGFLFIFFIGTTVSVLLQHGVIIQKLLTDVTASRIQSEIRDLDEAVDLQQFAIPNPAWHIYAGEISTTK